MPDRMVSRLAEAQPQGVTDLFQCYHPTPAVVRHRANELVELIKHAVAHPTVDVPTGQDEKQSASASRTAGTPSIGFSGTARMIATVPQLQVLDIPAPTGGWLSLPELDIIDAPASAPVAMLGSHSSLCGLAKCYADRNAQSSSTDDATGPTSRWQEFRRVLTRLAQIPASMQIAQAAPLLPVATTSSAAASEATNNAAPSSVSATEDAGEAISILKRYRTDHGATDEASKSRKLARAAADAAAGAVSGLADTDTAEPSTASVAPAPFNYAAAKGLTSVRQGINKSREQAERDAEAARRAQGRRGGRGGKNPFMRR
jgi:hypothetical protein